jgi:hypothetical protein
MLGHLTTLHVHHIFPKALLYKAGYKQADVNAVANFCFLTQDTNLAISDSDPADYFRGVEAKHPGALASQWIPMDESLWRVDRYLDFLAARRELLAAATNTFLDGLLGGGHPTELAQPDVAGRTAVVIETPGTVEVDFHDLVELLDWMAQEGYAQPAVDVEAVDPVSGGTLAVAEAYWPDGLQEGLGNPVVLELDPAESAVDALAALGFQVFTTVQGLRDYVHASQAANAPSPR